MLCSRLVGGAVMLRPEDCIPGTLVECIADTAGAPTVLRKGSFYNVESLVEADATYSHGRDETRWEKNQGLFLIGIHEAAPCKSGRWSYQLKAFRLAPAPKQKERV